MKRAVANFLLKLAMSLGAKRVTVQAIKDAYSSATADAALTASVWQPDNSAGLNKFLTSDHGQIFFKRLRAIAAAVAIKGAQDRTSTIHAAGVSTGWDECLRYIHSLSRVSGVQDTTNTEQAPQDEASLLEQLSP